MVQVKSKSGLKSATPPKPCWKSATTALVSLPNAAPKSSNLILRCRSRARVLGSLSCNKLSLPMVGTSSAWPTNPGVRSSASRTLNSHPAEAPDPLETSGQTDSVCVEAFFDCQVHVLHTREVLFIIRALPPMHDHYVQVCTGELVQADPYLLSHGMTAIDFSQQCQGMFDFLGGQGVRQHQVHNRLNVGSACQVCNRGVANGLVRNSHHLAFSISYPRAAQAYVLHHSFNTVQFDLVADPKWFVSKHRHGPEKIGQRVLRRQANCQCANGKRSNCCSDVDADVLRGHHYRNNDDKSVQALAQY